MIKSIILTTVILVASTQADFLMKLTDKNGVEESLCIKSYSYSNNLESLHKQQAQTIDEYSIQETLTNKRYLGKPVYRKLLTIDGFSVPFTTSGITKTSEVVSNDLEKVVSFYYSAVINNDVLISPTNTMYNNATTNKWYRGAHFYYSTKKCTITFINTNQSSPQAVNDVKFIVEYTKTTDIAASMDEGLTTLVHYLPSNSTTDEYVTKSTADLQIGFFKNYTYDSISDSCIPASN
jgi:hypothetical protein